MTTETTTLDDHQIEVATTAAHRLDITAGAGSGKTAVLIRRVGYLLGEGASARSILVLAFTKKAASEAKERLEAAGHTGVICETIHSWCMHLLRVTTGSTGYATDFTLIDEIDAAIVLEQVIKDLKLKCSAKDATAALNGYYTTLSMPGAETASRDIGLAIGEYHTRIRASNVVDYGMLQVLAHQLLVTDVDLNLSIRHVLVDEVQDLSVAQHKLIDVLCSETAATLTRVGDDRQAIYRWRNADPRGMVTPLSTTSASLRVNYRSGCDIVDAANIIQPGWNAMEHPKGHSRETDGAVEIFSGRSASIVRKIADLTDTGYGLSEIAVLCRTNRHAVRVEKVLNEAEIECHRIGSKYDICTDKMFRRVLATMMAAATNKDIYSMIAGIRGGGPLRGETVWWAASTACTNWSLSERMTDAILAYWQQYGDMSVVNAVEAHLMRDAQDDYEPEAGVVTIATVHAVKGLEWPAVIIANCDAGSWPHKMAGRAEGYDGYAEERCVFYVAMTRAKEYLGLHYRTDDDVTKGSTTTPSEYLKQLNLI